MSFGNGAFGSGAFGSGGGSLVVPVSLADTALLSETITPDLVVVLQDLLSVAGVANPQAVFGAEAQSALQLLDHMHRMFPETTSDTMIFSEALTLLRSSVGALADELGVTTTADVTVALQVTMASSLALQDLAGRPELATLTDTATFSDALSVRARYYMELLDALGAADALARGVSIVGAVSSSLVTADTLAAQLVSNPSVLDELELLVWDGNNQELYQGWVVNAKTGAPAEYANYSFNSVAKIGGRYYGASATGLYLLEGDDDAGVAIDAVLRTGRVEVGGGYQARVERAYLGVRSSGKMVLKTITGDQVERWYEGSYDPAGVDTQRVKLGRGVKSRFWQFELINKNGADFELERIELLPVVLKRRV